MRGGAIAKRPRVHDGANLRLPAELAANHEVTAFGKCLPRRQARELAVERAEARFGAGPEQPARAVIERAGLELEIAASKQHRAFGEERAAGGDIDFAFVGIADERQVAAGVEQRGEEIEHRLEALLVGLGESLAVGAAGHQAQEQRIEREALASYRLLAVYAVGGNLRKHLALEQRASRIEPAARLRPIGEREAGEVERRALCDEM